MEIRKFSVTKLGERPMILGIPWLKRHNPHIHWSRHQITFGSEYCLSECQVQTPCTISAQSPTTPPHPEPSPSPRSQPQPLSSLCLSDSTHSLGASRSLSAAPAKNARLPNSENCMQQTPRYQKPRPRTRSKSLPTTLPMFTPKFSPKFSPTSSPMSSPMSPPTPASMYPPLSSPTSSPMSSPMSPPTSSPMSSPMSPPQPLVPKSQPVATS